MGKIRIRPRRIPVEPPKPKKEIAEKVKTGLKKTGGAVATGVASYGIVEGIGTIVEGINGGPQNNNNNPIIVQMPAPEPAKTTALATVPTQVSGEMFDLKVLVVALMIGILVVMLIGVGITWVKSREKHAVKKFKAELEKPK